MVDSPQWVAAKAVGDSAEIAIADWFRGQEYQAFKTLGDAPFDLLVQATVEVKRDLKSADTGNVAVEVSYRGQLSGIYVSKATFWAFVLSDDEALLVRTPKLLDIAVRSEFKEVAAGYEQMTRIRLVPVNFPMFRQLLSLRKRNKHVHPNGALNLSDNIRLAKLGQVRSTRPEGRSRELAQDRSKRCRMRGNGKVGLSDVP